MMRGYTIGCAAQRISFDPEEAALERCAQELGLSIRCNIVEVGGIQKFQCWSLM